LHATQVAPPVPQPAIEGAVHVVPEQQPDAHDVPSQTQEPTRQRWPAPHAGPLPHAQVPLAEQASAVIPSQAMQAAPPTPQVEVPRMLQVDPEQQPLLQAAAQPLHTPPVQVSAPGQTSQIRPALPQAP